MGGKEDGDFVFVSFEGIFSGMLDLIFWSL